MASTYPSATIPSNQTNHDRASLDTSRYLPQGYQVPPPSMYNTSDQHLAPPAEHRPRPESETLAYQPVAPEQYQAAPYSPRLAPARISSDYAGTAPMTLARQEHRPHIHRRDRSTDSRRSAHSHTSSRSHRSHVSCSNRRSHEYEYDHGHRHNHEHTHHHDHEHTRHHDHDHDHDHEREERQHHRHSSDDDDYSVDGAPLKRKNTHRPGYGGSLFAFGSWIKDALTGS